MLSRRRSAILLDVANPEAGRPKPKKEECHEHGSKDGRERFYEIVNNWSAGDLDEICSPDLRGHAGADLAELQASIDGFLGSFPELRAEVKYLVCEGDLVSAWLSYTATHQQEFAGIPGSGRPVMFAAWDLLHTRTGKSPRSPSTAICSRS